MKFGVREICDVVLKAKANQKVGNKIFYKNEPVIYFDTLKTSSMEGAATTVYAQGGRGNSRLMAWEGERTVTFTMEDALISPAGFMILSGAGLTEASADNKINVHVAEQTDDFYKDTDVVYAILDEAVSEDKNATIYVMPMINGEIITEPFIGTKVKTAVTYGGTDTDGKIQAALSAAFTAGKLVEIKKATTANADGRTYEPDLELFSELVDVLMVDYYTERSSGAQQIDITPDKFGGNYYLEASTLFRDTNGVDMPAEFIIPNCKIQSNFTFTMASSGDPSTFTFTMDAFPDYTRFNPTKKVLAAIQIVGGSDTIEEIYRPATKSYDKEDSNGIIVVGSAE